MKNKMNFQKSFRILLVCLFSQIGFSQFTIPDKPNIQTSVYDYAKLLSDSDKKQLEVIDKRNTAEGFLNEYRNDLEKYGDQLSEEEKSKLEEASKELEETMKGDSAEDIHAKTMPFMQALSPLTTIKLISIYCI
jgi:molecular chaperone DnaK (HSP70)